MTYSESRFIILLFLVVPLNIHTTMNTTTIFFPKKKIGKIWLLPGGCVQPRFSSVLAGTRPHYKPDWFDSIRLDSSPAPAMVPRLYRPSLGCNRVTSDLQDDNTHLHFLFRPNWWDSTYQKGRRNASIHPMMPICMKTRDPTCIIYAKYANIKKIWAASHVTLHWTAQDVFGVLVAN